MIDNTIRRNPLLDRIEIEFDSRPPAPAPGFFYNKRHGEHICLADGARYRERVKNGNKRVFVQGR